LKILAGDIGGTKTLLQIATVHNGTIAVLHERRFDSQRFASFDELAQRFCHDAPDQVATSLHGACLAVAGPVENCGDSRRVNVTNLPWSLDEASLAALFNTEHVRLVNDFEAVGYGTELLTRADVLVLQHGAERHQGNRMTLGAGTGFGYCQSLWQGDHYHIVPSEAGHTDFAPTDAVQIALLSYLLKRDHPVALEQVLSGPGLRIIFDFLRESRGAEPGRELHTAMREGDSVAAIAQFGQARRDPLASDTLDIFVRVYGAIAGNLALLSLPYGGIYVAGGIAPKLSDALMDGRFAAAFGNKGKMSALMARFPVYIVRDETIGLKGAALIASRLSGALSAG
jgi:glucokinase